MRITFVVMGWENISVEYISAYLKKQGHEVCLAYEQALFDDKNYLCIPFAARILSQGSNIIKQVIDTKPDVIGFSVMAPTFQWAVGCASEIKKYLKVPVIFGGSHAIMCPEIVIAKSCVDIVCTGEGEIPLAQLLTAMEQKKTLEYVDGFWFKDEKGNVIKNKQAPLLADLDAMPFPDKDLFAPYVPIKNYYLASTSRGCPFNCTYCSVSYVTEIEKQQKNYKKVRERSVDSVIQELKINLQKYRFKWVDFRNSVFSPRTDWVLEFCEKYPREINLPFRIFGHPLLVNEKIAPALRDAKCFAVQMGLESYDPFVRNTVLKRYETNEQIHNAVAIFEKYKTTYSLDYILGLPHQKEEELKGAAEFFSRLKHCYRISPFMFSYLPKLEIVRYAVDNGFLDPAEVSRIEEGFHDNYMHKGSGMQQTRRKTMETYKLLFRLMSFMPPLIRKMLYRSRIYFVFRFLPFDIILRFYF